MLSGVDYQKNSDYMGNVRIGIGLLYKQFKKYQWKIATSRKKTVKLRVYKDYHYKFTPFGHIVSVLFSSQHLEKHARSFEYRTFEKFESNIKKGDIVLDIGANIGLFSLFSSQLVGETGRVISFEPNKKTFGVLERNLRLNQVNNVSAYNLALSKEKSKLILTNPKSNVDDNNSDSYNRISFDPISMVEEDECIVDAIKLDTLIESKNLIGKIDFIKIDIEGAEKFCFEGAIKSLSQEKRPIIIMESFDPHSLKFGVSTFDTLLFLSQFGYSFEQFDHGQWIAK